MKDDCQVVRVQEGWWADAARLCVALHDHEGGSPLAVTATVPRVASWLQHLTVQDEGACLVALCGGRAVGALVVQWDLHPYAENSAIASGLWCEGGAPRSAAWRLMLCAALELERRGIKDVAISAVGRNQKRRTYRRMGFTPRYRDEDGCAWYVAPLSRILGVLEGRQTKSEA